MTQLQKGRIERLQRDGLGYRTIASELNLPVDTVKSYCRRHPIAVDETVCQWCGAKQTQTPHKRKRRFCSDKCRMAWWKEHPEQINRKKIYTHTCLYCGQAFQSFRAGSKYCSRQCFANKRRRDGQ